jgi:hypothetical protein
MLRDARRFEGREGETCERSKVVVETKRDKEERLEEAGRLMFPKELAVSPNCLHRSRC